ncbi:MAG: hypothetical protein ABI353_12470 [Isosphaeraceae bacterium]
MPRSQRIRIRRPSPRFKPSIEAMEAREMLSAIPHAPPRLARALPAAPAVDDVVARHNHSTLAVTNHVRRTPGLAMPRDLARLDRQYVQAIRSRDLKAWRSMLATVRHQDRPAWRGIVRALHSHNPRVWSRVLSAFRTHFPGTPGVPSRQPGEVGAPTAAASPSVALPLGPGFDLGTRWSVVHPENPSQYRSPAPIAISPDSTVWAAFAPNPQTLYQYDPYGQTWYNVWEAPGPITSISAGATNAIWGRTVVVSYTVNGVASIVELADQQTYGEYMIVFAGGSSQVPGKSSSAQVVITQVAGPSQLVLALSNGVLSQWNESNNPAWSSVSTGGLNLRQIAITGSNTVWAIATFPGTQKPDQLYQQVNKTWQAGPVLPNSAIIANIAGTGDGTLWAQDTTGYLYTLSADGSTWLPATITKVVSNNGLNPVTTNTNLVTPASFTAFAAGTKYRAVAANPNGGVQLLTYGLADQPKTGYPGMTTVEKAAYDYISSTVLGLGPGVGVRELYTNLDSRSNLSSYESSVNALRNSAVPSGLSISLSDWKSLVNELYDELNSVNSVYNTFTNISALNTQVYADAGSKLSDTSQMIQLSKDQQTTAFAAILDQVFSAALGGIVKAFSGGAGVVASLIASGINAAVSDLTKGQSDQAYQLSYLALETFLSDTFSNAAALNSALRAEILADPNRFLPIGVAVRSNTLVWPDQTTENLAEATENAFHAFYFSVLTPLVWPLYYYPNYPESYVGIWPSSASSYYQPDSPGSKTGTVYFLGTYSVFNGWTFPNPTLNLLPTITSVTGATTGDVLTNQLGWWKQITLDDWNS